MINLKRSHALLAVAIAAFAVYANSLWNGFAYDDVFIIMHNDRVHQLRDMAKIWLTPYWPTFGSELGLYRPFAIFAFAIEWAISGGAPWFFHLVNILLHIAVSTLVFLLIESLFTRTAALAGAIIFAIHPLHTEAVANVVGQNELWAALGVVGACLIYVRRPEGMGASGPRKAAIFALFVLALLAKESAVVLPGLLLLLDVMQGRVQIERASLLRYTRSAGALFAGFIVLLGGYLVLRHQVLGTLAGTNAAPGLPYLREEHRLLNAFRAWPEFVRLLFFPLDLSVEYAPGVVLPVESFTPMAVFGMLLVLGVLLLTLATPIAPRAGLIAGWFLITILPVSNFFFPIGVLIAERTLYLPSIAVCFLAGFAWEAASNAAQRETRRLTTALAVVICLFFGVRTAIRNPDWDSLSSVWKSLNRDHPESYRAQWLNALSMWGQGRHDLAERYFQIAYRIWPRDSQLLTEWGNFYLGQGKWDQAIALLEQSRDMTPFVPRTQEYLAFAYLYAGRHEDALVTAQHAAQMPGGHRSISLPVLAAAHEMLGQYDEAVEAWERVVRLKSADLWLNRAMLARAQAWAGRNQDALHNADVALSKTEPGTRSHSAIREFKKAINDGCYVDRRDGCDPLLGWKITVGSAPLPTR